MKTVKQQIISNEVTVGSWLTIHSLETVEIMGQQSFDWLVIDMEHSAITLDYAQAMVRTIQGLNIPAYIRVEKNDANVIKRVMDTGANGIIVPMVLSAQDARAAVESVYYPPKGKRGVGLTRAQGYGANFFEYKDRLTRDALIVVIIEHIEAVDQLEEILSVDGVDASMIGPYDLSGSLGYPGEYDRSEVKQAIEKYMEVCKRMKKPAGYHVVAAEAEQLKAKMDAGFSFLAFSLDEIFLAHGVKQELAKLS